MRDYSYIGKGRVYLANRDDGKLRYVGNCDKVELSVSEETKELKSFTHAGGGVANSVTRIDKLEIALNLFDYSPDNIAMALYGEANAVASGKVLSESHVVYPNHLARLEHSHIRQAIVKDAKSDVIFKQGTDYEVVNSGIYILDSGQIKAGTKVTIDYQYEAADVIHALVNSGHEYHMVFDGMNEAQSGKKVVLELYRVKFSPASSLSFVSDDFGSLEMKGIALADYTQSGVGMSQYLKLEMEQ